MYQTTPSAQGITRKAFLAGAAAGAAAFTLKPKLLWGKEKPIKIGGQFSLTGGLGFNGVWGDRSSSATDRPTPVSSAKPPDSTE